VPVACSGARLLMCMAAFSSSVHLGNDLDRGGDTIRYGVVHAVVVRYLAIHLAFKGFTDRLWRSSLSEHPTSRERDQRKPSLSLSEILDGTRLTGMAQRMISMKEMKENPLPVSSSGLPVTRQLESQLLMMIGEVC
jgi:hypothetical protein